MAMDFGVAFASLVVCTVLFKVIRRALQGQNKTAAREAFYKGQCIDDLTDIKIPAPNHPHIETAVRSPQALRCSNPEEPAPFETELCSGCYMIGNPLTSSKPEASGGWNYGEYFNGKKRLWEFRMQMKLKSPAPAGELFFGIEMEEYVPMNAATKAAVNVINASINKAVGGGTHQSPGDDPLTVEGEIERPHCVFPFWAWDQIIVTPEGEDPPSIDDADFPNMGIKRSQGMRFYASEVAEITKNFRPGPTYTFSFWGCARFVDVINWELVGVPIVTPMDFDKLCGRPPVHVVVYTLLPPSNADRADRRHLDSRRITWFDMATWSSNARPTRRRLEALVGKLVDTLAGEGANSEEALGRAAGCFGPVLQLLGWDQLFNGNWKRRSCC
jgi:hypothetical protein